MLACVDSPGGTAAIIQHPASTISFWAKVKGTGLTDLRMFPSQHGDKEPLFNIGTASDSASDKVDFLLRQDPWTVIDHVKTDGNPLHGTRRDLAFCSAGRWLSILLRGRRSGPRRRAPDSEACLGEM